MQCDSCQIGEEIAFLLILLTNVGCDFSCTQDYYGSPLFRASFAPETHLPLHPTSHAMCPTSRMNFYMFAYMVASTYIPKIRESRCLLHSQVRKMSVSE